MATAAVRAAETASATAAGATSASSSATPAAAGATSAVSASIWTTIAAAFRSSLTWSAACYWGVAVEVGFVVGEIGAAFDG